MKHYIYMQGIAGCIPAYCAATRTLAEARELFVEMNDYCIDEDYRVDGPSRRAKLSLKVLAKKNFPGTLYAEHVALYLPGEKAAGTERALFSVHNRVLDDDATTLADVLGNEVFEIYECDCDTPWIHEENIDGEGIGVWLEALNKGARYEVIEAFNGFYVYDNKTGECRGMGDVVVLPDCPVVFSLERNGGWMAEAWTYVFNRDEEYVEAYFG